MPKKINCIFRTEGILDFHNRGLTPLEPNLTEVAWRAKEFTAVAPVRTQLF